MVTTALRPVQKVLSQLKSERAKLDNTITVLEGALNGSASTPTVRTRRPMSAAARKALSQRMTAYWAKRRSQKKRH